MGLVAVMKGVVNRMLPQYVLDQNEAEVRLGRYQELTIIPMLRTKHPLADEGSYWTIPLSALGSPLTYGTQTAFADTTALLAILNTDNANNPNAKNIYLDRLALIASVLPASATGTRLVVRLDSGPRVPTANNTQIAGIGGTISAAQTGPTLSSSGSIAKIYAATGSAITLPAVVNAKTVYSGAIDSIPVVGGERTFRFGSDGPGSAQQCNGPPVIVPPGWWCSLHVFFPGSVPPSSQFEGALDWFER